MAKPSFLAIVAAAVTLAPALGFLAADCRAGEPKPLVREIFVPFADLDVLLESQPQRVLLSREQYEELLKKAAKTPESHPPQAALVTAADYAAAIEDQRARLSGTLAIEVLDEGLQALPLEFSGVGLRSALLDGKAAALARASDGRLTLFVEGKGRHELVVEMVAPLETTAARQVLTFRLPQPPAARFRLTAPGDVEVKSGASVAGRVVDAAANVTRFELIPAQGDTTLVMTLNSRLQRLQRAVVARSVLVDEITQAYERLHATVSLGILHQPVDRFRFVIPEGFEVTEVSSPLLSRWAMEAEGGRRVLDVRLREPTVETVVLGLSAVRMGPPPEKWTLPKIEPLEVVGQVAVVGLLVEDRLGAESIAAAGLVPIDLSVFQRAIPPTVLRAEPGAPPLRPTVAYYAPQAQFSLQGRFPRPPAEIAVRAKILVQLEDRGQEARGAFLLLPTVERLFAFDFSVPAAWHVIGVTGPDGKPLPFERYGPADQAGRIQVRLPQGVPAGKQYQVLFHAQSTPPDWLAEWPSRKVVMPVFAVAKATRDAGAVAVAARDDLVVRPETLQGLTPLDEAEKDRYGLGGVDTSLAYRYEGQPYQATLTVARTRPRLTARTFSFLRVESDALVAHCEIVYRVDEARTRQLSLLLPKETPAALSIRGLDDLKLKEYSSREEKDSRRWDAVLAEPRRGTLRLAVDFQQPLPFEKSKKLPLPLVAAADVLYQSGLVAVEGSAELDVQVGVDAKARRVDVGELVDAAYQPGARLLGAYGFVGDPPAVSVEVTRHPEYGLYPAIVQKGELRTFFSADGVSQTQAVFQLRTKALYLEIVLPEGTGRSDLWSVLVDQQPVKPQREGDRILVSLPAAPVGSVRALKVTYQTPVGAVALAGSVSLPAPRLMFREDRGAAVEVPVTDLVWHVYLPSGYEVVRSRGTVVTTLAPPEPAVLTAAKAVCGLALWRVSLGRELGALMPVWGVSMAKKPAARPAIKSAVGDSATGAPAAEEAPALEQTESLYLADDIRLRERPKEESKEAAVPSEPEARPPTPDRQPMPTRAPAAPAGPGMPGMGFADAEMRQAEPGGAAKEKPPTVALPPGAPPSPAPPPPKAAPLPKPEKKPFVYKRFEGFSSLNIDLAQVATAADQPITFQSLGVDPRLEITLANRPRLEMLGWALALLVGLVGLARTNRPLRTKTQMIVAIVLVGTIVPLVPGLAELALPLNLMVFAACALVPYYLLAGLVKRFVRWAKRQDAPLEKAVVVGTGLLVAFCLAAPSLAQAQPPAAKSGPYVIQVVEPPEPVKVPEDAVLLPYDPDSLTGIRDASRMLVPYAKYVELWNRAYPDKKLETKAPPAPFALAGGSYTTTLEGSEYLLVDGQLVIDVFTDQFVLVPLALEGGVIARAELDGKPARLTVVQAAPGSGPAAPQGQPGPQPAPQPSPAQHPVQPAADAPRSLIAVQVAGKGRHGLQLSVRLRLDRRGGWRVVEGVLPYVPATALAIVAPQPQTELRLGPLPDRRNYEIEQSGQRIETTLGPGGAVGIQWRPKVGEGQVDRSLTAQSNAVLDVQEDGLRLVWQLALEFRRSQRESFTVFVPADYLVEKVEGTNVRGWEVRKEEKRQAVEVSLLKPARDSESFALRLWRAGAVGTAPLAQFDAPAVLVADAALQSGQLTIRRSPLLDVRTESRSGLTRTDLSGASPGSSRPPVGAGSEDSPLGIRPYEAYQFATMPFALKLSAAPIASRVTAEVQSLLKIADEGWELESWVVLDVKDRPIHQVEIFLPDGLRLDQVSAGGEFQWALTRQDKRPLVTVYLASGRLGEVPLVLRGTFDRQGGAKQAPLPRLELRGVERQQGEIAVQADPALEVTAEGLERCQPVDRRRRWLKPGQVAMVALVLEYREPDYRGTLKLAPRKPVVHCDTVTNVRVTDRAVEETILLDFNVEQAGIRQVAFLLPARMKQSRIQVRLLRQKTVEPVPQEQGEEALVRVRLELQDDVMHNFRVLVENDRLLTPAAHAAPIPRLEMEATGQQFVTLQSAGKDEVIVEKDSLVGVEALGRDQDAWKKLQGMFGQGITQAFLVQARPAKIEFKTRGRAALQTAGARIGLAETTLVLDAHGAYRAAQVYRLNNSTEQFLDVELPEGAALWTAWVAGEPVKPTQVPGVSDPRRVRIPLVKTAPGDLDYQVVLKYGGRVDAAGLAGRVPFPLPRTQNIDVELSHVRLHLPPTHHWFYFSGTMRQVSAKDELEAGRLSYQSKEAQRLMDTVQQGDDFAKVRAASNLKRLVDVSKSMQAAVDRRSNEKVQQELDQNKRIVQQAEQELERLKQVPAQADGTDNRLRMNELFEGQRIARAHNVVSDLGYNFEAAPDQPAPSAGQPGAGLNALWLSKSQLENPAVAGKPKGEGVAKEAPATPGQTVGGRPAAPVDAWGALGDTQKRIVQKGKTADVLDVDRLQTLDVGQTPALAVTGGGQMRGGGKDIKDLSQRTAGGERGAVERYQERLQQQAAQQAVAERDLRARIQSAQGEDQADRGGAGQAAFSPDGSRLTTYGAAVPQAGGRFGGFEGQAARRVADQPVTGEPGQAPAPGDRGPAAGLAAGLTSLDLELPTRGTVYLFTTPGGETQIAGWAVAAESALKLAYLVAVLAVVVVVLWIVRCASGGGFRWLAGRAGAILLICLGVLLLIAGFLVAGLALLVAGVVLAIRRVALRPFAAQPGA